MFGSPSAAIVCVGVAAAIVTSLGRNAILPIVNASATCLTLGYLVTCVAVVRLRRDRPSAARPFRVPGGMVTIGLAIASALFSFGLSLYQPYVDAKGAVPLEWIMLASWIVIGGLAWVVAAPVRNAFDRTERRRIIVGEG